MICDQFDVLYEDGAKTGRVMSICLHPFLVGYPHRSKYFAKALAHITSRQEVWLTTGSEIVDWYKQNYLKVLTANTEPRSPLAPISLRRTRIVPSVQPPRVRGCGSDT